MTRTADEVAPSPGGTLGEYACHLRSQGETACLTAAETQLWMRSSAIQLLRLPLTCMEPVDRETLKNLMRLRRTWLLDYLVEPDDRNPPNAFLYLCRDPDYGLTSLSKNGRKAVRRGLRNVSVRRLSWDELAQNGYPALVETNLRHGYAKGSEAEFRDSIELRARPPFHEIWGAWQGPDLVAWLTVLKVSDWAEFVSSPSRDAAHRNYANNALRYEALRHLLTIEKRRWVGTGLTTIKPDVDRQMLHIYNTRMGFEAIPVRRVLLPCWWLRPLVAHRPAAWAWSQVSRAIPWSAALHNIAGLARFVSGAERQPLAWAEDVQEDEESR